MAVRGNIIVCAVIAAAICFADQSRDAIRAIAEDWVVRIGRPSYLLICTLGFSFTLWFTSLNLLRNVRPSVRLTHTISFIRGWLPIVMATLPWFTLLCGLFLAAEDLRVHKILPAAKSTPPEGVQQQTTPGWNFRLEQDGSVTSEPRPDFDGLRIRLIWMAVGVGAIGLIGTALLIFFERRDRLSNQTSVKVPRVLALLTRCWTDASTISPAQAWVVMNIAGVLFMAATAAVAGPPLARLLGPIAVLMAAATFWSFVLNPLVLVCRKGRIPLISVILLFFVISGVGDCNDNHEIRRIKGARFGPTPAAILTMQRWLAERPDYQFRKPYPVFLVAAEGGGIRNAYWTASVLCDLHDSYPEFGSHLFAISGVSGGSVGACVYAALVREKEGGTNGPVLPLARKILAEDLLSPLVARGATADLLQQCLPFRVLAFDRARALEASLGTAWREHLPTSDRMEKGFRSLREHALPGSNVPVLLLNTTDVDTGRPLPISHIDPDPRLPGSQISFHDAMLGGDDLHLSTAAFLGARFPIVTPAGTVDFGAQGKRRFVDGGYFENSGTATLLDLIQTVTDDSQGPGEVTVHDRRTNTDRRVSLADVELNVIVIAYRDPPPLQSSRSFGDPFSPIRALLASREGRGAFSVDRLERYLVDQAIKADSQREKQERLSEPAPAARMANLSPFLLVYDVADQGTPLPLGWTLSETTRLSMDHQLRTPVPNPRRVSNQTPFQSIGAVIRDWKSGPKSSMRPISPATRQAN